jgi:antitoxin VapB
MQSVWFAKTDKLPYTLASTNWSATMHQKTARVGKNNRAQVVTIPLEFRFPAEMKEVFIRKIGDDIVLSPRPQDWSAFLTSDAGVSDDFMAGIEDLPVQERANQ